MAHLLRIDGKAADPCHRVSMASENLTETDHLESWIKSHPEVIDDTLMVVTTQFHSWASDTGKASERPDLLALSSSGELVVVELKREGDRRVHLQAITYGAMASEFSRDDLARAHVAWVAKEHGESISTEEALARLIDHVDGDLQESVFRLPRLLLVAESFPDQVMSTVQWLADIAPDLTIECHEYQVFRSAHDLMVSFQRLFPVDDLTDRRLRPAFQESLAGLSDQVRTKRRNAKSVTIIAEHELVPDGATVKFDPTGFVKKEVLDQVQQWLAEDPNRASATWESDPAKPLKWVLDPTRKWTPTGLKNEIFVRAGLEPGAFSAADAWQFNGRSLYKIAKDVVQD